MWSPAAGCLNPHASKLHLFQSVSSRLFHFRWAYCRINTQYNLIYITRSSGKNWSPTFLSLQIKYLILHGPHRKLCVFTEPLASNGRLFWLHYSGFQAACHIGPTIQLLVPSSLQAYHCSPTAPSLGLLVWSSWGGGGHRQQGDLISLPSSFQNKECRLKT
jgi:hypothetical protein